MGDTRTPVDRPRRTRRTASLPAVTLDEIRRWPPTVDIPTTARALGISRSYAFELARRGALPCRVLRVGSRYRVPTAAILAALEGEPASETA